MTRFLIAFLFIVHFSFAQEEAWIKNSETHSSSTEAKRMALHPNGSVYVVGEFSGSPQFDGQTISNTGGTQIFLDDGFIARYSDTGSLIWVKQAFLSTEDFNVNRMKDIKVDKQGNLVMLAVSFYPTKFLGSETVRGFFLAKSDADGNLIWTKQISTPTYSDADVGRHGNRIVIDNSNNIIVLTDQASPFAQTGGLALTKVAPDGNITWNKLVTVNNTFYSAIADDLSIDADGNMLVSASFEDRVTIVGGPSLLSRGHFNPLQCFVAKFDSNAKYLWSVWSDDGSSNAAVANTFDNDGNAYIIVALDGSGTLNTPGSDFTSDGTSNEYFVKLDRDGKLVWYNKIRGGGVQGMTCSNDGYIYMAGIQWGDFQYQGYTRTVPATYESSFIMKASTSGYLYGMLYGDLTVTPSQPYGSTMARQVLVDADKNIYTYGNYGPGITWGCLPSTTENTSFYLVKHNFIPNVPLVTITGSPHEMCGETTISLSANIVSNAVPYTWYLPDGVISDAGPTGPYNTQIQVKVDRRANNKAIVVSFKDNCREYFGIPFDFDIASPPAAPSFKTLKPQLCAGSSAVFEVNVDPTTDNVAWQLPVNVTATDISDTKKQLNFMSAFTGGDIKVTTSNQCGTSSVFTFVSLFSAPGKPDLNGNLKLCSTVTDFVKNISPVAGAKSYLWTLPPGIVSNPSYSDKSTSLHAIVAPNFLSGEITVQAVGECETGEKSNAITVTRYPKTADAQPLSGPEQLCVTAAGKITYSVPPIANATTYVWTISDNLQAKDVVKSLNNLSFSSTAPGIGTIEVYGLNICNEAGGKSTMSLEIIPELPEPHLELTRCDRSIIATNVEHPAWFKDGVVIDDFSETGMSVPDSGSYHVEVRNFCGVKKSNSIEANPVVNASIVPPNVITPNGDGKNDVFNLGSSLKSTSMLIIDRQGGRVFEASPYLNDWDGDGVPAGTYYYILEDACLTQPYRGWISVVR